MQGDPQKTGDQDFETGRINFHLGLLYTVPWFTQFLYKYIKMTKLQSHSVSIGEFSVHDIPNFETPLVRGSVPYLDSVTSKRLKDFVMCLEYENELALSGAILNFPRTLPYSCDPLFRRFDWFIFLCACVTWRAKYPVTSNFVFFFVFLVFGTCISWWIDVSLVGFVILFTVLI